MRPFAAFHSIARLSDPAPVALEQFLAAQESPLSFVVRLVLIGAVTGSLAMIIFAVYTALAPRMRRYVSHLRMRRIRRSHRSPESGRNRQ